MMRQNFSPAVKRISRPEWAAQGNVERTLSPWAVRAEVIIKAEVRRLFHALTAPEYIETWMSFPGHMSGCANVVTRVDNDFVIEHLCHEIPTLYISGTYSACERRNLEFTWRVEGEREIAASYVDIRLSGYFEYTTLKLAHSGFASKEDYIWHKSFWSLSLARLKGLYNSTIERIDKPWPHLRHNRVESARKRKRPEPFA